MQVTMGAMFDRTREYLGTTDKAVIAFRRIMIDAAKRYHDHGVPPPTVDDPTLYRVRGCSAMLPRNASWVELTEPWRRAFAEPIPEEYRARGLGDGVAAPAFAATPA